MGETSRRDPKIVYKSRHKCDKCDFCTDLRAENRNKD